MSALLGRQDTGEVETTWLILDEFPSLGKVEGLAAGPERLRKYGGAVVLGMQQVSQIQEIYGHDVAQTIIGQCATKLILRCQDPETAKHMAEQLGRRQARRVDETVSYGANSLRDGVGLTPREELELVALPDEVMNLPKFQGFIRVSNARHGAPFPISTLRFAWRPRDTRAPGLVPRPGPGPVEHFFELIRRTGTTAGVPPGPPEDRGGLTTPSVPAIAEPSAMERGADAVAAMDASTDAARSPERAYDRLVDRLRREDSVLAAAAGASRDGERRASDGPEPQDSAPTFDPFGRR